MRVKMINSVDEYVAGEEYDLDDEVSDRFIALGYAEGEYSREIGEDEFATLVDQGHQTVGV